MTFDSSRGSTPKGRSAPGGSGVFHWTTRVYNVGYLLRRDDTTLFYTGDTREPSIPDGLRADFLIHESTYADRDAHLAHEFGHSTASEAAHAATVMRARRLFLTHIGGREGTDAAILREVRAGFPDSTVAEDGTQHDL